MTTAIFTRIGYASHMNQPDLKSLSDEALLARIADRDASAFEEFCGRFLRWAWKFDIQFFQNTHEADDAVQEKFLKLWQKAEIYQPMPGSKVKNFLLKIDKNICIDMLRKTSRKSEVSVSDIAGATSDDVTDLLDYLGYKNESGESGGESPEFQLENTELMDRIYSYTRTTFNKRQFLVFWGFVTGMSYQEIADTYGLQKGSVRGYVARGFAAVRREFSEERSQS